MFGGARSVGAPRRVAPSPRAPHSRDSIPKTYRRDHLFIFAGVSRAAPPPPASSRSSCPPPPARPMRPPSAFAKPRRPWLPGFPAEAPALARTSPPRLPQGQAGGDPRGVRPREPPRPVSGSNREKGAESLFLPQGVLHLGVHGREHRQRALLAAVHASFLERLLRGVAAAVAAGVVVVRRGQSRELPAKLEHLLRGLRDRPDVPRYALPYGLRAEVSRARRGVVRSSRYIRSREIAF